MRNDHTAPDRPDADALSRLQDELRLIEDEIGQAQRAAEEFRSRIGERGDGATDLEDRSAAITQAEEQEELLGFLTTRREKVQERIRTIAGAER